MRGVVGEVGGLRTFPRGVVVDHFGAGVSAPVSAAGSACGRGGGGRSDEGWQRWQRADASERAVKACCQGQRAGRCKAGGRCGSGGRAAGAAGGAECARRGRCGRVARSVWSSGSGCARCRRSRSRRLFGKLWPEGKCASAWSLRSRIVSSTVACWRCGARRPLLGRHEPYESRGSRADLWGLAGAIPAGYPAIPAAAHGENLMATHT